MSDRFGPKRMGVQEAPALMLLNTPEFVPAYTVSGTSRSIARARTSLPVRSEFLQVAPASSLLNMPKLVPAYRTVAFDRSMTRARTAGPVRPELLACQVVRSEEDTSELQS